MKPGPKPKGKVKITWSPNFAYAIGLIASDGNLSPNFRGINFTSKDLEQVTNFQNGLKINIHIGKKARCAGSDKKYFVVQFNDIAFYKFLVGIGITPAKSKTIGALTIPDEYFFDFLRGEFDGDGHSYSYWDKRWKSSFIFYIGFSSASLNYLAWIRAKLKKLLGVRGRINLSPANACYQLEYAKSEAIKIIPMIYPKKQNFLFLSRKRLKIMQSLAMMSKPFK